MELQQLRYVVAIAEEGNFTRAAERSRVVQSALSHQIKALENELGVALFARTNRRVEITAAGEAFLVGARAALDAAERAATDAAAAVGEIRGALTVGLIPTVTAVDIPAALAAFHRAYPSVKIALSVGSSDEFIAAINAGEMDVAVLGLHDAITPAGPQTRVLARERLVAVVSANHRFAGRRRVSLEQLAEESFVDFPADSTGRAPTDLAFHEAGVRREVPFEAMNLDLILGLVRTGLAITLLAPAAVPNDERLCTVEITAGPTRIEYLAWSGFNPSPAALAFIDFVGDGAGLSAESIATPIREIGADSHGA